mmetsp:Transcript_5932/g.20751  ORF Transcript_5932/g.20751 Transcript_5932/m.20751 type:complete len:245 (+) Transcript_5932:8016-8750(+)
MPHHLQLGVQLAHAVKQLPREALLVGVEHRLGHLPDVRQAVLDARRRLRDRHLEQLIDAEHEHLGVVRQVEDVVERGAVAGVADGGEAAELVHEAVLGELELPQLAAARLVHDGGRELARELLGALHDDALGELDARQHLARLYGRARALEQRNLPRAVLGDERHHRLHDLDLRVRLPGLHGVLVLHEVAQQLARGHGLERRRVRVVREEARDAIDDDLEPRRGALGVDGVAVPVQAHLGAAVV